MRTLATDPANPTIVSNDGIIPQVGSSQWQMPGLTKREYFAAMAMQGYIAAGSTGMPDAKEIALYAIQTADELINALNK